MVKRGACGEITAPSDKRHAAVTTALQHFSRSRNDLCSFIIGEMNSFTIRPHQNIASNATIGYAQYMPLQCCKIEFVLSVKKGGEWGIDAAG